MFKAENYGRYFILDFSSIILSSSIFNLYIKIGIIELLLKITSSLMNEVVKKSSKDVRGFVLITRKEL